MSKKKRKLICLIIFIIYLLIVLTLTVFRFNVYYNERQLNLSLFVDLIEIYRNYGIGLFLWLFLGNIFWFIPFGFLLPILIKKHNLIKIMLFGLMFSLTIESLQFFFYKGVAEIDDLILNTLGVLIGYGFFKLFCRYNFVKMLPASKGS